MRADCRVAGRLSARVSELASHVAGEAALPKAQAGSVVDAALSAVGGALACDERGHPRIRHVQDEGARSAAVAQPVHWR